ncbi:MAG TPA: OsmC family protein [Bryobacteraceae bacterium]|jgi:uncharacterized OsmC-like protein|nr:OsmC family protein [Bryobacteraceae bacterium]
MEVIAERLTDAKYEVAARGHRLICDQPLTNGGDDAGMTPPELLMAALATCSAYYAAQYLRMHNLPADQLKVRVAAQKTKPPARLSAYQVEVIAPGLDSSHAEGILRAARSCLIHNSLVYTPSIELSLNSSD